MGKDKDNVIENMVRFLKSQSKAEKTGEKDFECPICGGNAIWGRATGYNNHLHCKCLNCGFAIME